MLNILKPPYFQEHYSTGFLNTRMTLPADMVDDIKQHYQLKESGHNDFPKFFVGNEHQAYMEGRWIGFLLNRFPGLGRQMVKRLYDRAYHKAVYCEQHYISTVLEYLLSQGLQQFFEARYIVASYDMYLRNSHHSPPAGIHTDLPNFHHFYETENDISLYIPLVDLDDQNGGQITVLPGSQLKLPGNLLLKLLREHFSRDPACLDENGYVDPDRITPEALTDFIKSKPHQDLMNLFKDAIGLAKTMYAGHYTKPRETKGEVLFFSNKDFHAAEQWRNPEFDREVYVIRMFPLYDARIRLRRKIHGTVVNRFLLDMKEGSLRRFDEAVDVSALAGKGLVQL